MTEHQHSKRIQIDLSSGWSFVKKRMSRSWYRAECVSSGEPVDLPHCWNSADDYQYEVEYYRGYGSYRKDFLIPPEAAASKDMIWSLESEGFYGTGTVWLNGSRLADVDGQYIGFSLEPGGALLMDSPNKLGIRLTNRCRSYVLPGIKMPDFLLYGGLSGRVSLCGTPALSLELNRTRITCSRISRSEADVNIRFVISNKSHEDRWFRVDWSIVSDSGKEVVRIDPVEMNLEGMERSCELELRSSIPNPELWSLEKPGLYRAVCRLTGDDGLLIDCEAVRFGIRDAVFVPDKGFFLNGERVELRGCNRHESMPGFGRAVPSDLHSEDATLMKAMGLNFVRLSHYPQHPGFLDRCDELGIMVYAEIATWKSVRTGWWLDSACRQMEAMIRRDRNHPSVILWGMGNESRSRKAYIRLGGIARELDPERPVTYAENHFYRAQRCKTTDVSDVWGLNYDFDAMEEGYRASRLKSVIVSECSNYPEALRGDMAAELKQVEIIEQDLARMEGLPYVAGFALWCWNDYGTLRKGRYRRYSGIVDAWRVPKMSSALIQAKYRKEPFVKIFGDWAICGKAVRREVHIFTNCDEVVLALKGREILLKAGKPHIMQEIEFADGELRAVAKGKYGSAQDSLVPFGAARRIALCPEACGGAGSYSGTAGIMISILDERGNHVADWNGDVSLEVEEPGAVMSYSGDGKVMISGGRGRGFVNAAGRKGLIKITASSGGLEQGTGSLEFS